MTAIGISHPHEDLDGLGPLWVDPELGLVAQIERRIRTSGWHPARTLVLLPYAQLLPVAREAWSHLQPVGFAPRFETTQTWLRSLGPFDPGAQDLSFERGRDVLSARGLLEQAGLGAQSEVLTARLLEAAYALAPVVAALPQMQREDWAQRARGVVGLEASLLVLEAATARIALEWVLASSFATDRLLQSRELAAGASALDGLIVLEGFQTEPLIETLKTLWAQRATSLALVSDAPQGQVGLHEAANAQDEAQRAAACVLQHLQLARVPVALATTDRVLTRRIRALLAQQGVALRDETGWKLSTTRAAATLMTALRACRFNPSSDAVLDWLKEAPALDSVAVQTLERLLRRAGLSQWRTVSLQRLGQEGAPGGSPQNAALPALLEQVADLRQALQAARTLAQWLASLRTLLQATGELQPLQDDAAGARLLEVLRLREQDADQLGAWPQAARRLTLAEFTAWVDEVLEAASFVPQAPPQAQVVLLPLSQMLGRTFAALVLPGCDEQRLNPSPEPEGHWTPAQRAALGLPSRADQAKALRAAWLQALRTPHCDVLWRRQDDSGEPLLPSVWVQALQLAGTAAQAPDPRAARSLAPHASAPPKPQGHRLPVMRLSATAYEDLRRCPYRFFALRQLGLQEADELESEVDKRDFGLWLHAVLKAFHDQLQQAPLADTSARRERMDAVARDVTARMHLDPAEFLPFDAAWPQLRDGYLVWLAQHEATGARFASGESEHEQAVGPLTLFGKLDRIDTFADGSVLLVDYKTESATQTSARIKQPFEDTQLAFYAALMPHDSLRAAYVNVGEKDSSKTYEQEQVVAVRDALIEGVVHDFQRLHAGAALPALGEGLACEYCAARGLCRKDFWSPPV